MSIAERVRHRSAGFTFLEVIVVLAITSLLALVVERTLSCTYRNGALLDATRRATGRGQAVTHELHETVNSSRRLFQDDDIGRSYLDALDLSAEPRSDASRLPLIDETGRLGPDLAGEPCVGSVLLFVEEADPLPCVIDAASGRVRYIDSYRFVCIYPNVTDRHLGRDEQAALDLVVWRSIAYPCLAQIRAVEDDTERRSLLRDLVVRFGLDITWDPDAALAEAFFDIDAVGTLATTPDPDPEIAPDPDVSDGGRLVHGDVQLARSSNVARARRPVLSVEDTAVWAPDGLEVKIVGPSGSRQVWIHLVVASPAAAGQFAVHASTIIVAVRDL